ncbi:MAG: ABC transporter permease [Anaerolineales bacterium]|nr:ABC transporter permease [Anaerolineales bacterium]
MLRVILSRLLQAIPVLFGVSLIVFLLLRLVPGDPVSTFYGFDVGRVEDLQAMRHQLGLDRPMLVQYVDFLADAIQGDMGTSIKTRRPVATELVRYLTNTAQLAVAGMIFAVVGGILLGLIAAARRNSIWDNLSLAISLAGISLPIFWLGLMLVWIFAVQLSLLPSGGRGDWHNLILPAITLAAPSVAVIARVTRASLMEVINQDFVRTAYSKGLSEAFVLLRHVLPNGLLPVITVTGIQFGYLLAGTVLTETVFAWPGLGRYLVDAIKFRDYPVVQGGVLVIALIFVTINLVVDVLYFLIDPRLHSEAAK